MHKNTSDKQGFTLIELSIVLVIIGLVVGGVLIGNDLISSARLRSQVTQIESYKTAVNTFRLKYNAIPGDMARAENFWGSDAACPNTPGNGTPKTATCNGNGDGRIYGGNFTYICENFRFWQHLGNAGLVAGQFTGATYTTNCMNESTVVGINVPYTKYSGAGVNLIYMTTSDLSGVGSPVDPQYANKSQFLISRPRQTGPGYIYGDAVISAVEAMSLETKLDDMQPATGQILAYQVYMGIAGCVTDSWALPSDYDLTTGDQVTCSLVFAAGF